jgi:hypothetical protein
LRILFFLAFFLPALAASSQTVILNVERDTVQEIPVRGPNLKRFSHPILRVGFVLPGDNPGARMIYGSSVNIAFGIRRKFKVTHVYSLGIDVEAQYTGFKLRQDDGKRLPDTILYKAQRFDYNTFGIGWYNRINFDPGRGNTLGNYLDLGIMGQYDFSIKNIMKTNAPQGVRVKTIQRSLPFVNNFNAKVYARAGFNKVSVYFSYRITPYFKSSYDLPELPKGIIGVELAVF